MQYRISDKKHVTIDKRKRLRSNSQTPGKLINAEGMKVARYQETGEQSHEKLAKVLSEKGLLQAVKLKNNIRLLQFPYTAELPKKMKLKIKI